ncbi:MAG: phosphoribosylformylglycinamidine cyclo-ligase [Acidobacteriota bacterium]|nr:phosphoribosylformylglycinamidine cyclo-ligase [Acidobacteriota bacterium]
MSQDSSRGAYSAAGVDIDAQDEALAEVKRLARGTFTSGVLTEIGGFGGLFRPDLSGMEEPVIIASADGVGTKLMVARMARSYATVGEDLVNHCVNDILVQGARPLFFMDYVGAGVLEPRAVVELVQGVTAGCRTNGCALLGGETAEMPGFYQPGDYELVGFIVGMADRARLLDGSRVQVGDALLGLPSSGLHTNGYSLARKILFDDLGLGVDDPLPVTAADGESVPTVGEELLKVHRSYLGAVEPWLDDPALHGLAHITGGGLTDNLPRTLPEGAAAEIDPRTWTVPPVFRLFRERGRVAAAEMFRVFNMGIGMVLVVDGDRAEEILGALRRDGHGGQLIGRVVPGDGGVIYRPDAEAAF